MILDIVQICFNLLISISIICLGTNQVHNRLFQGLHDKILLL